MNRNQKSGNAGFTLIEVIVVLALVGILAAGLGVGLIKGVESYLFASEATQLSQKAQVAMARIKKELTNVQNITEATAERIRYTPAQGGGTMVIERSGNRILMRWFNPNGSLIEGTLVDGVSETQALFSYFKSDGSPWAPNTAYFNQLAQIRVSLSLIQSSGGSISFNMTVNPRGTDLRNEPFLN